MLPAKISKKLAKQFENRPKLLEFFFAWVANNRNGVKAYQSLHPNCSYGTAGVRSCQMLKEITDIDKTIILEAYGIGHDKYFEQMKEGIEATDETGNPDHKTRYQYHRDLGEILKIREAKGDTNIGIQINQNKIIFEDFSNKEDL
jgi:hypothetical protein